MKRDLGVDRAQLLGLLRATLREEKAPAGEIAVILVGDRTMQRLNRDFRSIDKSTDVLSFSYLDEPHAGGVLGEIYVSPAIARAQAEEAECGLDEEIARLALHGVLHILGWEHDTTRSRRRMLGRQERYLDRYWRNGDASGNGGAA